MLQKQEARIKRKLIKIDSVAAMKIFADAENKYKSLKQKIGNSPVGHYIPKLDTLVTSFKFLEQNPQLAHLKDAKDKVEDALGKMTELKEQFNKAENLKKFLKERKQYLKEQLDKFGFAKQLKRINKHVYL